MLGVTLAIIQDKRIKRKDNTYAIKLRVTYQAIQKYYPLGVHLTVEDWAKVYNPKVKGKLKEHQLFFNKIEQKAHQTLRTVDPFSFEGFNKAFNKKTDLSKDVFTFYDEFIKTLKKNKQYGTASSYNDSKNSFKAYIEQKNRKKLNFGDITPQWLQSYEDWMLSGDKPKSITTVGIYARPLRTIINYAIREGIFNREFYPFGKGKYIIPLGKNIKKALKLKEIEQVYNYKTNSLAEEWAKSIWIFSYLCNGANLKDIAHLKYKNISSNSITFIREKTKRTTKSNIKPIVVSLIPETKILIDKWGIKPIDDESYVFGIIDGTESEERQRAIIAQKRKEINTKIKAIGKELKFQLVLTLGVSRHCWSTRMLNLGASVLMIGEGLGHQSSTATQNYLGSFEDEIRAEFQNKLLKFNENK